MTGGSEALEKTSKWALARRSNSRGPSFSTRPFAPITSSSLECRRTPARCRTRRGLCSLGLDPAVSHLGHKTNLLLHQVDEPHLRSKSFARMSCRTVRMLSRGAPVLKVEGALQLIEHHDAWPTPADRTSTSPFFMAATRAACPRCQIVENNTNSIERPEHRVVLIRSPGINHGFHRP